VVIGLAACSGPPVIEDAGTPDSGVDAGPVDAGLPDAGTPDAGRPDAGLPDAGLSACAVASDAGSPFHLRAAAANLSSGNLQSYDPGEGLRIITGLQPDIVMMQEMNYGTNDAASFAAMLAVLDGGYVYARGTGQIPNGILSRFPITDAGEWTDPRVSNRTFAWAQIDLPGPRDLWVVSVHLLTSSASERNLEANALVALLAAKVPEPDFLLIGGDFNTGVPTEAALSTLAPRGVSGPPYPADQAGLSGTNASRAKQYDHVLVSRCLGPLQVPVVIGDAGFAAGLVFDSRVYMPLSDVPPVLSTDSAAVNMQHMAVVKDFLVQP
jgi:endonuclease/exonuclease/phosphatase family metal-dependent hydrolase